MAKQSFLNVLLKLCHKIFFKKKVSKRPNGNPVNLDISIREDLKNQRQNCFVSFLNVFNQSQDYNFACTIGTQLGDS